MYSKTYEMENFKVSNNDIVVKATSHQYWLTVTWATVITSEDFPNIPMTSLHFKSFEEILVGKYRTDLIVGWFLGEADPFFKLDLNYLLCSFFTLYIRCHWSFLRCNFYKQKWIKDKINHFSSQRYQCQHASCLPLGWLCKAILWWVLNKFTLFSNMLGSNHHKEIILFALLILGMAPKFYSILISPRLLSPNLSL